MVLSFERGKDPKKVLEVGRAEGAFKVKEVKMKVVVLKDNQGSINPPLGKYFRGPLESEYTIPLQNAYTLLLLVLKRREPELRYLLRSMLDEVSDQDIACVTFMFKGEPGEKFPKTYGDISSNGEYYWKDCAGIDLLISNKIIAIPEGRLESDSDFQLHLKGNAGPVILRDSSL